MNPLICPHCKTAELKVKPEGKTNADILQCPQCKCVFRVCLVRFEGKCFAKQFPEVIKALKEKRKENGEIKRKRGRPRKREMSESVSEETM